MALKVHPLQNPGEISSVGTLTPSSGLNLPKLDTSKMTSVSQSSSLSTPEIPSKLDPQVINLAKAIRQTESNNNFQAKGKSGEYGAYQFTNGTWNSAAQKYLGTQIPLEEATPEQQNEVAYKRIADWKSQGYTPGQIASMWNAGEGEPNAYTGSFSNGSPSIGVNKFGAKYSVPAYANKVATAYQQFKAETPDTFNPTPFSNPNPGEFDFSGNNQNQIVNSNDKSKQPNYNQDQGLIKNIANYDIGVAKSVGQLLPGLLTLGGKIRNFAEGKGFQQEVDPDSLVGRMNQFLSPSTSTQAAGNLVGDIGQFFVPGAGEDQAAALASKGSEALGGSGLISKLAGLAGKGAVSGVENAALAEAQGGGKKQSSSETNKNAAIVGGISAVMPFAGELLSKTMPIIKDFFGGSGTADALKVKNATPELVNAWKNGTRTVNDLADTITETAKNYETQGRNAFNAMKASLPDISMPQNFVEGGLQKSLSDVVENAPNLNASEERTLANLQKYVNNADIKGVKGILDLNQGIDNAGFYRAGDPEYKNSNKIIQEFRNIVKKSAINFAEKFDETNGTNYAEQVKKGLADASDRIKFMDKFKANFIGTNPETYVERTVNKLNPLIKGFGDEGVKENTKALLEEFEKRIGQPGLFAKDFQAANAARNLKGLTGRLVVKGAKTAGIGSLPFAPELLQHLFAQKNQSQ